MIQVLLMKIQGKVMVIAAGLKFDLFVFSKNRRKIIQ